jgi:ankyrin repeat protein
MAAAPAAAADAPSETNLLKAVTEGALDVVKKMLDPGVSEDHKKFCLRDPVNCKDPTTGFPPLMLAAINGRATMCELLVRKKAALDCVDERGNSPLHRATIQNDLPVIEALVAQGMSVDLLSKSGLTPLHCAAIRGNIGVSELLLSLGAAPTVHESGFRSTPLHFAAMEVSWCPRRLASSKPVAERIVDIVGPCVHVAVHAWQGHTPLGRILINKGSSMNARTSSGDSAHAKPGTRIGMRHWSTRTRA